MKIIKAIDEFIEYRNKIGDRLSLYKTITDKYQVLTAIYPGSHIDITPSLVIPNVIYIDNFSKTIQFFKHIQEIKSYISAHKKYDETTEITFIGQDYTSELAIDKVDLIISQYAGFVGQPTKKYLKINGILLCNDSHGDATLARFDDNYELIGVIDESNKIIESDLEKYFKSSNQKEVDLELVKAKMKGPKYKYNTENYIFRRIK